MLAWRDKKTYFRIILKHPPNLELCLISESILGSVSVTQSESGVSIF